MIRFITYITFFCSAFLGISQHNIREQVYVHVNSNTLISGESLYFSAFCVSEQTGKYSPLSKILYVELVGSSGAVYQEKIQLENGKGHSDFFISSLWATGQYQLLAYTRWMKNFEDYSRTTITIVNPYEDYEIERADNEPKIDFFPANNQITAGVENLIGFYISGKENGKFSGKIVSEEGETISNFTPDAMGFGKFKLKPKSSQKYQAILEDNNSQLYFFDLPKISNSGTVLHINETANHIEIRLQSYPENDKLLTLKATGKSETTEWKVKSTSATLVSKKELDKGNIYIEVIGENGILIASRIFHETPSEVSITGLNQTYQTRQEVVLTPELEIGNYSVSVRKKNITLSSDHSHFVSADLTNAINKSIVSPEKFLSTTDSDLELLFLTSDPKKRIGHQDSVFYLPEVREEIIRGKIQSKNLPVADQNIGIAFRDDTWQLRIGKTDESGAFAIPFQSASNNMDAYLTSMNLSEGYEISVESPFLNSYPNFDYSMPSFDSTQIRELVARSIRNQIENAYYESPKVNPVQNNWLPQVSYDYVYVLDDYTRFTTLKETFTEYIVSASAREKRDPVIKAYYSNDPKEFRNQPLILLDGVPVDAEKILEFSPYKIESISILNNRYFSGSLIADGLVCFETKEDTFKEFPLGDSYLTTEVKGVTAPKSYSFPDHKNQNLDRIPDQRDQLYWNPNIQVLDGETPEISFYCSDVEGAFEVLLEGFTKEGKPVSKIFTFEVKSGDKI